MMNTNTTVVAHKQLKGVICSILEITRMKTLLLFCSLLLTGMVYSQEICNNGIDDDGDGLVDCADGDCATDFVNCPAFLSNNLSCPPSGIYADIIGTNTGFKPDDGTTGPISLNYPVGTESIRLVIQGNYQNFDALNDPAAGGIGNVDFEHGDDRLIYGIIEIDLASNTSSGSLEYLSNMVLSSRYVWKSQPLGPANTSTYVREGTNAADLPNFEFVFNSTGTALEITCLQGDVNLSYFTTFYGNSATQSMTRVEGPNTTQYPAYFPAGTTIQAIDLPLAGADFITITTMAVNQNRTGNFGALVTSQKEEGNARKEMIIDLNTNQASGIVTVGNGSIDDYCSTYSFDNYDVTSALNILASGATIVGETSANITGPDQIGRANPTLHISGGQLIITRDAAFANDFNEIYYIKFYKRTGLPWSSGFKQVEKDYISPTDIGYNASGSITFTIPDGTRYATVFASGNGLFGGNLSLDAPSLTPGQVTNENQVISYAEIDLLTNTHEGYNVMLATATNQQMYAWTGINVNPAYDFAVFGPTVGQLPSSNDRINFDVNGNTLELFFTNHTWAMERVVLVSFVGQYPDVLGDTIIQEFPANGDCDSLYFSTVTCNGGSQTLDGTLPFAVYSADPTVDPTSVLLLVDSVQLTWSIGQCDTISFAVSTNFLPPNVGNVHVVFNDDGTFASGLGNPIGTALQLSNLSNGLSYMAECNEDNNLLSGAYEYIPLPPADLGNDTLICGNFLMNLDPILDSNYTYVWQDASTDSSYNASTQGLYWVEVTDYRNCVESDSIDISMTAVNVDLGNDTTLCQGETILLDATQPGATYLWQDASVLPQFNVNATGQYWVELDLNGCLGGDTINVTVNPIPAIDLGPDVTICDGQLVTFDATTIGATYLWNDGTNLATLDAQNDGQYWVEITQNNCSNSDTVELTVTPNPVFDLGPDQSICDGDQVVLDPNIPNATYLWQDASTGATYTVTNTGTYSVEITVNNCSSTDDVDVVVNPIPAIDLGPDIGFCPGQSATFDATTNNATYDWQDGSNSATYSTASTGTYWVEITVNGCSNSDTVQSTLYDVPQFSLSGESTICESTFDLLGPVGYAAYDWQDGSTSPNFTVTQPGTYSLTVTNTDGCSSTDYFNVENGCEPSLWVPNVFTPDGDTYNETFYAVGEFIENFEMLIFNRWGEVVKELHDLSDFWDGTTSSGKKVSDGVYTWLVHYSYYDEEKLVEKKIHGHVTVIR